MNISKLIKTFRIKRIRRQLEKIKRNYNKLHLKLSKLRLDQYFNKSKLDDLGR